MKGLKFCVLAAFLFLGACNGKSDDTSAPLAALQSPNAAENYGDQFWNDQLQRKTELWSQALGFCQQARTQVLDQLSASACSRSASSSVLDDYAR